MESSDPTKYFEYKLSTDDHLLKLVASGKIEALEELHVRYAKVCYGWALRVLRDPCAAEEIVQDIFLKIWTAPLRYVPARSKVSTWLLIVVRNQSLDRLRHERRVTPTGTVPFDALDVEEMGRITPSEMLSDETNTPYEQACRHEQSKLVRSALNQLPTVFREVISLAYLDGLTQREVAHRLGVPLGTIKSRTQRALLQLRVLLSGEQIAEDVA